MVVEPGQMVLDEADAVVDSDYEPDGGAFDQH